MDEKTIRAYLLGSLEEDSEEREELERRLVCDHHTQELLEMLEDELIDEFVSGEMSEGEKRRFEDHFLTTPQRLHQLRFARSLRRYAQSDSEFRRTPEAGRRQAESRLSPFVIANRWAAASLILVVGAALLLAWNYELRKDLANARQQSESLQRQLASPPARPDGVLRKSLSPGALRGAGSLATVRPSQATTLIELRLRLPDGGYDLYRAVLSDASGHAKLVRNGMRPREADGEPILILALPAQALQADDYTITLSGQANESGYERFENSQYSLRVLRE